MSHVSVKTIKMPLSIVVLCMATALVSCASPAKLRQSEANAVDGNAVSAIPPNRIYITRPSDASGERVPLSATIIQPRTNSAVLSSSNAPVSAPVEQEPLEIDPNETRNSVKLQPKPVSTNAPTVEELLAATAKIKPEEPKAEPEISVEDSATATNSENAAKEGADVMEKAEPMDCVPSQDNDCKPKS